MRLILIESNILKENIWLTDDTTFAKKARFNNAIYTFDEIELLILAKEQLTPSTLIKINEAKKTFNGCITKTEIETATETGTGTGTGTGKIEIETAKTKIKTMAEIEAERKKQLSFF